MNIKNWTLFTVLTTTDQLKPQRSIRKVIGLHTITSPECQRDDELSLFKNDFCGFWYVAVNIMDKLQFYYLYLLFYC